MQANSGDIILIGMPGSGKSTCGVVAAKLLLKNFFDTDLLIQNREGQRLQQIIDEKRAGLLCPGRGGGRFVPGYCRYGDRHRRLRGVFPGAWITCAAWAR